MKILVRLIALALAFPLASVPARADGLPVVDGVKITILSDMIVGRWTQAEWGFSALIEITGAGGSKKILFDTGAAPDTVKNNARRLGIDLCGVETIVLSHNHQDHTMGLYELRRSCKASNPNALGTAYVGGPEIFWSRPYAAGENSMGRTDDNVMLPNNGISRALGLDPEYEAGVKKLYEGTGARFVVASGGPLAIDGFPGVWITGSIPRLFDEKTYTNKPYIAAPGGQRSPDKEPEDQALVINTSKGLVVLTGCAHSGVINTVSYARTMLGIKLPVYALLGGLHLYQTAIGAPTQVGSLAWAAAQLSLPEIGIQWLLGAHCTGIAAVRYLGDHIAGLDPANAYVSSVGTVFTLDGIKPPAGITNPLAKPVAVERVLERAAQASDLMFR